MSCLRQAANPGTLQGTFLEPCRGRKNEVKSARCHASVSGVPTPIQLPSQIFEKRKEKSAAGFSSPHCPWCDSHSHVDHIAFHKLETSIATFHSGFRRIPLAGSAKIIRKKTFNRHPCLHCLRYAIMGRWWRCNSITMGVVSSLSPADADVIGLLDREGVDQVDIALELTA